MAYAGTNIPYYLLGAGLRNEVRYVNVDGHRDWLMHDYHRDAMARGEPTWPNSRPGWDRAQPDFQAWLANLQAEGIQLLVVTRVNPAEGPHNVADADRFPIERGWAESHPEFFEPLYGVARTGSVLPAVPACAGLREQDLADRLIGLGKPDPAWRIPD